MEALDRSAFLLSQLQMHNAEQHSCMHRMVFRLMDSMQARLPSAEAWQAMTQACAEAMIACYKDRCSAIQHLMQVNYPVRTLQQSGQGL